MKTEPNAPINPCEVTYDDGKIDDQHQVGYLTYLHHGLTKREYFAATGQITFNDAWTVLCKAHPNLKDITPNMVIDTLAELKVMYADALINHLNTTTL